MKMKKIPNRQVHLDFHTSEMIDQVGSKFSAEEFADTLKNDNVEAVTLFVSGWKYENDKPIYEIEIPSNTEAEVTLPDGRKRILTAGSYKL